MSPERVGGPLCVLWYSRLLLEVLSRGVSRGVSPERVDGGGGGGDGLPTAGGNAVLSREPPTPGGGD